MQFFHIKKFTSIDVFKMYKFKIEDFVKMDYNIINSKGNILILKKEGFI